MKLSHGRSHRVVVWRADNFAAWEDPLRLPGRGADQPPRLVAPTALA